jgi:hypothetical protein
MRSIDDLIIKGFNGVFVEYEIFREFHPTRITPPIDPWDRFYVWKFTRLMERSYSKPTAAALATKYADQQIRAIQRNKESILYAQKTR